MIRLQIALALVFILWYGIVNAECIDYIGTGFDEIDCINYLGVWDVDREECVLNMCRRPKAHSQQPKKPSKVKVKTCVKWKYTFASPSSYCEVWETRIKKE